MTMRLRIVTHGLSAMSVYTDVIFVRMLAAAVALTGLSVLGIVIATAIQLFTDLATPGWATTLVAIATSARTAVVLVIVA